MNYIDIQTFLTITSCESLSKAAEQLYTSQPALSHRLSRLEEELDTTLIIRRKGVRSIELTESGKCFIPLAQKWMQLWQETQNIGRLAPMTTFRLSNVDSLNVCFMPQVCANFLSKHTSCSLDVVTLRSNAAYRAVENHEVDLAFIANPHFFRKVQTIPLFKERMTFICSDTAPYSEALTPSDLRAENEIYIPWSNAFLMWHDYWFGTSAQVKVSLDNMSLFAHFLHLEDAWAIVPSTIAHALMERNHFKAFPIEDMPESRMCYAIMEDRRQQNDLTNAFIQELLDIASSFPDVEITKPR